MSQVTQVKTVMLTVRDLVHTLQKPTVKPVGGGGPFAGKHVHFVGIGGSGMCGLAHMLMDMGAVVSGTDRGPSGVTHKLAEIGAAIVYEQTAASIPGDAQMVVHSAAIKAEHPELVEAGRRGLEIVKYAQMIGRVMSLKHGIAIAGTHGKSTTTAMTAHVLLAAAHDPSFVVGASCAQLGGSARSGAGDAFVVEACEYDRSFHNYRPRIGVVLNIEEDHLDYYKNLDEIVESFGVFMSQVDSGGVVLMNAVDANCVVAASQAGKMKKAAGLGGGNTGETPVPQGPMARVETFGVDAAGDWQAMGVRRFQGKAHFTVKYRGKLMGRLTLNIAGRHNVGNALVAAAICTHCGVSWEQIAAGIESFKGADRRSQMLLLTKDNIRIMDDYGHHPTEVRSTLLGLREFYRPERLICVFQPHQHSRTRFLLEDFARSFSHADLTIVPDIYFVRDSEADRKAVSSAMLVEKIAANGRDAKYIPDFKAIVEYLSAEMKAGDLIVSMGAGPVWEVTDALVKRLS